MGTRRNMMRELGDAGLDAYGGQIRADFLRELNGREAYKNYNEMRLNSPIIGALLAAIEMSVQTIEFRFAVPETGEDDPRVVFLEEAREAMSHTWADHISEVLTMLPFGFAPFTINYKRENGRIVWRKMKMLGQNTIARWLIDNGGGLQGLEQWAHYWPEPIPIERMLLYRINVERNSPEGRSMLRTSYIPYYYAKNLTQVEGITFERNGAGFPVLYLPRGADTTSGSEDMQRAERTVRNIRVDEQAGLVLPHEDDGGARFEFAAPSVGGSQMAQAMGETIKRHESRMLMGALAQFLLLGQDRVGALATFEGGVDFFTLSVDAIADNIAGVWTKYAIPRLLRLNGMDPDGVIMEHSPAGRTDLSALGEFLQRVGGLITWTAEDEQWLRNEARLPEKDIADLEGDDDPNAGLVDPPVMDDEEDAPPDPVDGMTAALFAATRAPDVDQRRRLERATERRTRAYFREQEGRILRELRR